MIYVYFRDKSLVTFSEMIWVLSDFRIKLIHFNLDLEKSSTAVDNVFMWKKLIHREDVYAKEIK